MINEIPTVDQVLASLSRLRVHRVILEHELQAAIAKRLTEDGISYAKEHRLGARNRIDFLVPGDIGGIGIEAKKGKPNSHQVMAQVERYAAFPAVAAIILVVERNVFDYQRSADGKPVHYVSLSKLWGIAL